jgi:hypothetical protein
MALAVLRRYQEDWLAGRTVPGVAGLVGLRLLAAGEGEARAKSREPCQGQKGDSPDREACALGESARAGRNAAGRLSEPARRLDERVEGAVLERADRVHGVGGTGLERDVDRPVDRLGLAGRGNCNRVGVGSDVERAGLVRVRERLDGRLAVDEDVDSRSGGCVADG